MNEEDNLDNNVLCSQIMFYNCILNDHWKYSLVQWQIIVFEIGMYKDLIRIIIVYLKKERKGIVTKKGKDRHSNYSQQTLATDVLNNPDKF